MSPGCCVNARQLFEFAKRHKKAFEHSQELSHSPRLLARFEVEGSGALGGDRRDFWFKVRWSRLGLIDQNQSDVSEITHDAAEEVRDRINPIYRCY